MGRKLIVLDNEPYNNFEIESNFIDSYDIVDNGLFEMANLTKQESGLPYDIWIDSSGVTREVEHNLPRLKVKVDNKMIPVIISETDPYIPQPILKQQLHGKPFKNFTKIQDFIMTNYQVLIDHWNHKITDRQALIQLGKD